MDGVSGPMTRSRTYFTRGLTSLLPKLRPKVLTVPWKEPHITRSTDYLNGLRGWAALLVYISHHILDAVQWAPIEMPYGHGNQYYFVAIPFVRTFFTGSHMAVNIFFILSGYVLSRGVLSMLHNGSGRDKVAASLASSICRRWVRLWVPVASTTFLAMTVQYLAGDVPSGTAPAPAPAGTSGTSGPLVESTYMTEVMRWIKNFVSASLPLGGAIYVDANPHTWTIPLEFRGSIFVFLALFATHCMPIRKRLMIMSGLVCYLHLSGMWQASTFLSGMILSELDLLQDEDFWPNWSFLQFVRKHQTIIFSVLLIFGLHCAGQPRLLMGYKYADYKLCSGFGYMSIFIPSSYSEVPHSFYYPIGAIGIVSAVTNIASLKRIFESSPMQYLGRISFGLYLAHGPILTTLGSRLYAATGVRPAISANLEAWNDIWAFGKIGPVGLQLNFVCCHLILLPLTLYAGELITEFIDDPSIKLASWLYQQALI